MAGTQLRASARRLALWLSTPAGFTALFVAGFLIRLILARGGGFPYDMSAFGAWAQRMTDLGPWSFYPQAGEEYFVDYPPGYLYVLWGLGTLSGGAPSVFLLKLPPILADLGLAWLVALAAQRLTPVTLARRVPVRGLAAAAVLLNPAVIFVSAVWGQADSVLALLVTGAFVLLGTGPQIFRREAGGLALLAVAIGTKPQALFVLPVVVLLMVWRHVRPRLELAQTGERARAFGAGLGRVGLGALAGAGAGFALIAPFRMTPAGALAFYSEASATYEYTSVFALNLWGAVGFWRPDVGEEAVRFLGMPAVAWAMGAFLVAGTLVMRRAWLCLREGEHEGRVLLLASVSLGLVGFAVLTRIHERYLFLSVALLLTFFGWRRLRWLAVLLSGLYLANVVLPYVYYLGVEQRPSVLEGVAGFIYGPDVFGVRVRLISGLAGLVCLAVAWRVWPAVRQADPPSEPDDGAGHQDLGPIPPVEPGAARPWSLRLHPVGRAGALLALAAFVVTLVLRLAGLGHPPGMYFDEVYHARAGAEYMAGQEVFEWTHPPLAKLAIGASIHRLSGFGTTQGRSLDPEVSPGSVGATDTGAVWARGSGQELFVQHGVVSSSCELDPTGVASSGGLSPAVLTGEGGGTFVAGEGPEGPSVAMVMGEELSWRSALPAPADRMVVAGDRLWVITVGGDLVGVSRQGEPETVAIGAGHLSGPGREGVVWASFPEDGRIAAWAPDGERRSVVETPGAPGALAVHPGSNRVAVAVGDEVLLLDAERGSTVDTLRGRADHLAVVPETTIVWAVGGHQARAIEPHSGAVIGRTTFAGQPRDILVDPVRHRLVSVSDEGLECASGRPQLAWRLGSAVAGAAMAGLVVLLGVRLFGSLVLGLLAALFVAVDGLAFTMARFATIDSYTTAFVLAAWFCALSALYVRDRWMERATPDAEEAGVARRWAVLAWLAGVGVFGGLGIASKWVAVYGLAGIGLLLLWDGFLRGRNSVWRVAGGVLPSTLVLALLGAAVPLGIYIVSYLPFFQLGHGFRDLVDLQERMYDYHAGLEATHPFGSPWYGWPFGYRAVFLHLSGMGAERAEMWTIPNLVVFLGGLVAMVAVGRAAWRRRSVALAVVVGAAAVQYLPWTVIGRVLFIYHYLPVVPFLGLALAWFLVVGSREWRYQRHVTVAVTAGAVIFFLLTLPALVGWSMPEGYHDGLRWVLRWVLP